MNHPVIRIGSQETTLQALTAMAKPVLPATTSWLRRIENAFVRWQAKRLQQIPAERLWAQALQDNRSFAEIRRAQR